jgi:hypothetical protein
VPAAFAVHFYALVRSHLANLTKISTASMQTCEENNNGMFDVNSFGAHQSRTRFHSCDILSINSSMARICRADVKLPDVKGS